MCTANREDREENEAFQDCLVNLARVAGLRPAGRKHHRPGNIAYPAVQLAVNEIRHAAQEESDRHLCANRIGDGEQADFS